MQMHTLEFFLANRSHLMTPRKSLAFFGFFNYLCPIWGLLPTKSAGACAKFKRYLEIGVDIELARLNL
jgi:hypothetical protein